MNPASVRLGDNLSVSPLGFGGMALTAVYGGTPPDDALRTLHHAVDAGITFLDTADVYGQGSSEELVGRLLAERRDEVTVATKFGITGNPATGERSSRGDAAYVRQAVEASLRRLGTDVIDLYYLHRLDPSVPVEETIGAMAGLVEAGEVRHLGVSELTADELRRACSVHPVAAIQSEWSIWSRDVEANVVPAAAELGVGFVPYSPLGRGFLTGTVSSVAEGDARQHFPRFDDKNLVANQPVAQVVAGVATDIGATSAQVALAWLLVKSRQLGLPVVPIPGTRRAERVDENLGALTVALDDAQMATLDAALESVVGARSADPIWVSSGRE